MSGRRNNVLLRLLAIGPVIAMVVGCASQSIVAVQVSSGSSRTSADVVRITRVDDRRSFPAELELSEGDRSRAVAAYSNRAELLPVDQTIDSVVKMLVAQGFRDEHPNVIDQSDAAQPIPVEVDIEEFWGGGWQADYS